MTTATQVKERPILFSGAMVRALLAGNKTQTRRMVKHQPPGEGYKLCTVMSSTDRKQEGKHHWGKLAANGYSLEDSRPEHFVCPYGYPGDRLWVRETHGWFNCLGLAAKDGKLLYQADTGKGLFKWKPSIFMPRAASRLLLEIVSVRCERVQDISEADAIAEGLKVCPNMNGREGSTGYVFPDCPYDKAGLCHSMPETAYSQGWDMINGPDSWYSNPWVWVVEFKVINQS